MQVTHKLSNVFLRSKATGTEDHSGTTGDKQQEKRIAEGQQLDVVRVLPPGLKVYPPYITELSTDPKARAAAKEYFGLFDPQSQEASSSGAVRYNISSPRPDRSKSRSRARSTTGTKGETNEPERSSSVPATGGSPDNVTLNKGGEQRKQRSDKGKSRTENE